MPSVWLAGEVRSVHRRGLGTKFFVERGGAVPLQLAAGRLRNGTGSDEYDSVGLELVLASHYFGYVSPHIGGSLLIFAFIVTVIGGLGSLAGAAIASVVVAILQQFANFYFAGTGDLVVVLLLAVVLLIKPSGLLGSKA